MVIGTVAVHCVEGTKVIEVLIVAGEIGPGNDSVHLDLEVPGRGPAFVPDRGP